MIDVVVSYARADADWARELAGRLLGHGLKLFFHEWSVLPGDVGVLGFEAAVRESAAGIVVVSPASLASPRALQEHVVLADAAADGRLRFIPVLVDGADLPAFFRHRVWRDFRGAAGAGFDAKVGELAAVIKETAGRSWQPPETPSPPSPRSGAAVPVPPENLGSLLPSPPTPVTEPDQHAIVVCYAADDADYGARLAGQIRAAGLPVWSAGDLRPGDNQFLTMRGHLRYAVAVVVVMTPQSQDSDDITRVILEGLLHGRPFFPVLLYGERNYHLASTWYMDARDGRLLGADELALLRTLHRADTDREPVAAEDVLPTPLASPPVRALRVPSSASLARLDGYLAEREVRHADLLTTALLLEAAGRLTDGWMRRGHTAALTPSLVAGIDTLWARHTGGRQGFTAQRGIAGVREGRPAEFLPLSVAYGWRSSTEDSVPGAYAEFAERAGPGLRAGFFPTLRNPQCERFLDWYDQWTATVLAVHTRLQDWEATP